MRKGTTDSETGVDPPAFEKRKLFSGGMAQFMVLLNGIILTATAFFTLNIFIHQIILDSMERSSEELKTKLVKEIGSIREAVNSIGSIIELSQDIDDEKLIASVRGGSFSVHSFDQIFWMEEVEDGLWKLRRLLDGNLSRLFYDSFITQPAKPLVDYILEKAGRAENVIFIPNPKGTHRVILGDSESGREQPFAVIKPIYDEGRLKGVIFAYTRLSPTLTNEWLEKRQHIRSVSVYDQESKVPVYTFLHGKDWKKDLERQKAYQTSSSVAFGSSELNVDLVVASGEQEGFLEKIPYAMLLFGITLTLIGTLYVRSNQRQSLRLEAVNKELEKNNIAMNAEIHERERLNKALRKAERENRAVIDSVSDIIFEVSIEGEVLFLNEAWKRVTGFDTDYSLGRPLFDMIHPQDQKAQRDDFKLLVKGEKKAYRAFTRIRSDDGSFRAVELAVSMLRRDENKNLRVVGTITDVEERRRAEKALGEAERKYREIVENSASGIYQITPEGFFLSANPAMAKIFGYNSPESMLRDVRDANKQIFMDTGKRKSFLREVEKRGAVVGFESKAYKKGKKEIWISENLRAVVDDEKNLLYFEGSLEDVSERKNAELTLRKAKEQSDIASRAKSEFLANMSHELRTPLNSIIGFSEMIKNESMGPIGQKAYWEYARDIYDSGKRLLNIINDILDVSRIDAGERQLNESVVDLSKVLVTCLDLMNTKIKDKHMNIISHLDTSDFNIIGEELAIKQMLMNLLSNAIKFTQDSGTITLNADIDSSGEMHLSVTDTGIGIEDEKIQKALSPFGQLDAELDRSGSGTGLGLTLVNSLIHLHGGRLEIFSQKGIGTTATLIFPQERVSLKLEHKKSKTENGAESGQDGSGMAVESEVKSESQLGSVSEIGRGQDLDSVES